MYALKDDFEGERDLGRNAIMRQSEICKEYDFSKGVRGKYAVAAKQGSNVVRLDDDVAEVFHSAKEVNDLLRSIAHLVKKQA